MSQVVLSKAVEGFLLTKSASGRSPNTIRNYRKELSRFIEITGDKEISSVTNEEIERYLHYLKYDFRITQLASTQISPRKLTSKTLRNAWGTLSVFWRWVAIEFSVANPFKVSPIKAYIKPINPLSLEEIEAILKACEKRPNRIRNGSSYSSKRPTALRDKAIILTLLDTGARVSEVAGINIGDIDLELGRILVMGKGQKQRYIYIGKLCRQAIWKYITERYPQKHPPVQEPLFLHKDGIHRMKSQGVLLVVKRLGEKAGIPNVHPHRFRHTYAIQFLRNGGNLFELQHILGHEDLAMVKNYVKLAQLDIENAARRASPADNWKLR